MDCAIYLRKSRADRDSDLHDETETLARHEKILLELAKRQKLTITNVYREVVSGETISSRPLMQQLLNDVGQGVYDGVLVVEVERLARGNTIDQGIVSQTFKFANTKIITPNKTYDPNNEFDEEYFEFGLFMSRREYKTINRRLQRGRIESVKEGKYVGNIPPYGYDRVKIKDGKGFKLQIVPEEAEVVKMVYDWYTCENRIGMSLIARKLNALGIQPRRSNQWVVASVKEILSSPVYKGMIHWNMRKEVKRMVNGQIVRSRPRAKEEDVIMARGLHEPIINNAVWDKAQYYRLKNRRVSTSTHVSNPLAGLVVCGFCGRKMMRRFFKHNNQQYLLCTLPGCKNVSAQFDFVEESLINGLAKIINDYSFVMETTKCGDADNGVQQIINKLNKELATLTNQSNKLHDLLEQGVYTTQVFLERSKILGDKMVAVKKEIADAEKGFGQKNTLVEIDALIPKIQNIVDLYGLIEDAETKNNLLRTVIVKMTFTKEKGGRWHNDPKDFKLDIETVV